MLRLRTLINNEIRYIDLFDDEVISTDYSFAEIQNITAKNSVYSKSFSVPGSKNNNDIFQHFYNFNTSLLDYDIRDAFNAAFEVDGYTIFDGYIRMDNVAITQEEVQYNITFYSIVGKFSSLLGDKVLFNLNFSGLAHDYTQSNIESTLLDPDFRTNSTNPLENGELLYMMANYGYDYDDDKLIITGSTPIIDYRSGNELGYFDNIGSPLRFYYLKPAIQLKWIYKQIFSEAGFTISSNFFETAYFKRFYLPLTFNTDSLYLNQAVKPLYFFDNDQRSASTVSMSAYTWTEIGVGTQTSNRVLQQVVIENNINAQQFSTSTFRVPVGGNYSFQLQWAGFNQGGVINPFVVENAGATIYFREIQQGGNDGTSGKTLFERSIVVRPQGAFQFAFNFNASLADNNNYSVDVKLNNTPFLMAVNAVSLRIVEGPRVVIGPVDLKLEFPETEVKQIDFISGINRRLNLIVAPNPDIPNDFIVEPIIDYVGKGAELDWSQRLDYNSTINIAPTTSVINGTLYFSGENDEDYGNTEFTKQTNNIYGTQYVQLDLDYKSQNTIFNDGFSNAVDDVLQNIGQPNITIPVYYITREENDEGDPLLFYNSRKTIPRIVFRGFNLPAYNVGFWNSSAQTFVNNFFLENTEVDMFPVLNRFTTYPFGLTGLTHAVNFNKRQRFNQLEFDFSCYEDLYDVYYEDYIQDLSSSDNRILTGKFYIYHEEVAALRGNEKIYLDGSYYRINAMKGFDLTKRALTDVELIKLTREYEEHRVRYFLLLNCNDPSDIRYGNTDLNYTIYAYVGKRLEVDGDCYTIFKDNYRDNVVYERFTTGFQTNSFLPLFYDNCACTDPIFSVDVYDEKFCSIPQPTPTVSGANPPPLYYILQDCTGERQVLATSFTLFTLGQVVRTINGGNTCYFVVDLTTIINTNTIIQTFDNCDTCAAQLITPTPTRTLTPTPSATRVVCPCVYVQIYNNSELDTTFQYIECDGTIRTIENFPPFSIYTDCMCDNSWEVDLRTEVTVLGDCPFITPTPTASSVVPSPTPTTTRTPTPTPTAPFDVDAEIYLEQVLFAGGTGITATVSGATNILFTTLKSCGVYNKLDVMYPFLGGVANSTAINAKNTGTFFIQWFGGLTFNLSGVTGNGTNGFGNTTFKHNSLPVNDIHFSLFQNTANTNSRQDETQIGIIQGGGAEILLESRRPVGGGFNTFFRLGSASNISATTGGTTAATYIATRSGTTTTTAFKNDVVFGSNTSTYTNGATGRDVFLLAMNISPFTPNVPYGDSFSNNRIAFSTIGSGLTRSEVSCLNNAIVAFNTTLGRVF